MSVESKSLKLECAIRFPAVMPYLPTGDCLPEILRKISEIVDYEYDCNEKLKDLVIREIAGVQTLVGSSPLIFPIFYQVFSEFRPIRPEELEITAFHGGDPAKINENNFIVDYGLALDFSGNNHALALDFFQQIPSGLRDLDRLPAIVFGYGITNSGVGDYGVAPVYQDGTELRTAKILLEKTGKFDSRDEELVKSGLPSKLGIGKRNLKTPKKRDISLDSIGLSRFCFGEGHIYSNGGNLALTSDNGLIVSVVR